MTPAIILEATAKVFEITKDDLRSPSRRKPFTTPRQLFCYLSRKHTDASYPEIGRLIRRDHTTVKHGERATVERMDNNLTAEALHVMAIAEDLDRPPAFVFRTRRVKPDTPTFTTSHTTQEART